MLSPGVHVPGTLLPRDPGNPVPTPSFPFQEQEFRASVSSCHRTQGSGPPALSPYSGLEFGTLSCCCLTFLHLPSGKLRSPLPCPSPAHTHPRQPPPAPHSGCPALQSLSFCTPASLEPSEKAVEQLTEGQQLKEEHQSHGGQISAGAEVGARAQPRPLTSQEMQFQKPRALFKGGRREVGPLADGVTAPWCCGKSWENGQSQPVH